MADVVSEKLLDAGAASADAINAVVRAPFEHLCRGLGATNVRAR